jgi:hypothetical protein
MVTSMSESIGRRQLVDRPCKTPSYAEFLQALRLNVTGKDVKARLK